MSHIARGAALSALWLALGAATLPALPARAHERAEVFATCSGRLAALAARQRGLDRDAADSTQMAQAFDMLVAAIMPDAIDDGVPPGHDRIWRGRGWAEVAGLLADADYSFDATRAERALHAAQARIDACRDMVLPRRQGGIRRPPMVKAIEWL